MDLWPLCAGKRSHVWRVGVQVRSEAVVLRPNGWPVAARALTFV